MLETVYTCQMHPKPLPCMYLIFALIHCTARLNTWHCGYKPIIAPHYHALAAYTHSAIRCYAPSAMCVRVYQLENSMRCYNTYNIIIIIIILRVVCPMVNGVQYYNWSSFLFDNTLYIEKVHYTYNFHEIAVQILFPAGSVWNLHSRCYVTCHTPNIILWDS